MYVYICPFVCRLEDSISSFVFSFSGIHKTRVEMVLINRDLNGFTDNDLSVTPQSQSRQDVFHCFAPQATLQRSSWLILLDSFPSFSPSEILRFSETSSFPSDPGKKFYIRYFIVKYTKDNTISTPSIAANPYEITM